MLLWDSKLQPHKSRLRTLDQIQRLTVARNAITCVRPIIFEVLEGGPSEAMRFFHSSMALIRPAAQVGDIRVQSANALLNDSSRWVGATAAGVRDAVMCTAVLLQKAGGELSENDVYNIMSYSYQVILYKEVLSCLKEEMTEAEVNQLETANFRCIACITAQIELIGRAIHGGQG